MFRGVTRSEQRIGITFCAIVAGLWFFQAVTRDSPVAEPVRIAGPTVSHMPGELAPVPVGQASAAVASPPAPRPVASPDRGTVDVNTAPAKELESLPGIGPSKAAAIIAERELNGPFKDVRDLERVKGIGPGSVEDLAPYVTASPVAWATPTPAPTPAPVPESTPVATPTPPEPPAPVNINTATKEQLMELDGIGEMIAERIIQDRASRGLFRTVDELDRVKGIGPKTLAANRHRLRVR